jgi:glyoxylase-like metal-dependent hydrolase (beta-lactamase superfamily II)
VDDLGPLQPDPHHRGGRYAPLAVRVHHLNCGTLCPLGGRLVNGDRPCLERARLVCHCLLVETKDGLVLVDTGLGTGDVNGRRGRFHEGRLRLLGAALEPSEPAAAQVARLGFSPDEVRHVVLTHLDLDHAGGLADFPRAEVHVLLREHEAATQRRTFMERMRYEPLVWAHHPRWVLHEPDAGERWNGFESVRRIGGLPPELLLIPLHGHTRGHAGVAVDTGGGWLLHAGDAYFHADEMDVARPRCTPGLELLQRFDSFDDAARIANQARLREVARAGVRIVCSHDPTELERARRGSA